MVRSSVLVGLAADVRGADLIGAIGEERLYASTESRRVGVWTVSLANADVGSHRLPY